MPSVSVGGAVVSGWFDAAGRGVVGALIEVVQVDGGQALLVVTLVCCAIVVDALFGFMQRARRSTGITRNMVVKSVDGGTFVGRRELSSKTLGLVGRPDAIVQEGGALIPIERKAFGKRPRDKDIAQLLVYCRLIEEIEGVRPPHGYLIIGPTAKRFKISNDPNKQQGVEGLVREMREILAGGPCVATPHPKKCAGCSVRESCAQRR